MSEIVPVEQCDREAAAALIAAAPMVDNVDIIKLAGADDSGFVQAFARHRLAALSQSARPVASEGEAVEHVAQAIFDAIDPLSGDTIGTVIHMSDHLFWDDDVKGKTDLECQIDAVKTVCRAAAEAALRAIATSEHKEADHG